MRRRKTEKNARKRMGFLIRFYRNACGLTQMELSEKLGISYQQVQKYEYGKSELTLSRLRQVSEALGVPMSVFLSEDAETLERHKMSFEDEKAFVLLRKLEARGLKPVAIRILKAMAA